MTWNSEKIKKLRCRLGWTQADLARKLNCGSELIQSWESKQDQLLQAIEVHSDTLFILEKQAEFQADQVFHSPLAESILDETQATQVDSEIVKRRFYENN